MNRVPLIEKKADELIQELNDWAADNFILDPGERIHVKIEVVYAPVEISITDHKPLSMEARLFFTPERLIDSGFVVKNNLRRIHSILSFNYSDQGKITLQDLVDMGTFGLEKRRHAGKKMASIIKKILNDNDIPFR